LELIENLQRLGSFGDGVRSHHLGLFGLEWVELATHFYQRDESMNYAAINKTVSSPQYSKLAMNTVATSPDLFVRRRSTNPLFT
jgi:hypothetical protein